MVNPQIYSRLSRALLGAGRVWLCWSTNTTHQTVTVLGFIALALLEIKIKVAKQAICQLANG